MPTEQISLLISAVSSIISAPLVVIGWIVVFRQSVKLNNINRSAELSERKLEWKIQYIDQQIANYYGPIAAILREQTIIRQRIEYQFGRDYSFAAGKDTLADLTPDEQLIWKHFVDNYKIPLQREIINIMRKNAHLAESGEYSEAVDQFMDYVLGWELLDSQKRNGVPNFYEYHYGTAYPKEFNHYIFTRLEELQNRKQELIKNIS